MVRVSCEAIHLRQPAWAQRDSVRPARGQSTIPVTGASQCHCAYSKIANAMMKASNSNAPKMKLFLPRLILLRILLKSCEELRHSQKSFIVHASVVSRSSFSNQVPSRHPAVIGVPQGISPTCWRWCTPHRPPAIDKFLFDLTRLFGLSHYPARRASRPI
ncbi:hypothetical protein Nham_2494 [Nitrobacter hamburgensis X14]|uniref:Uncharacterized protein n=1 Tax=Nitrobacter hamburgensis (strain DSM 10229 / NCIMB 13809 / X14) TaxID=323097 RepID=Q1QKG3_NITHX|nr:hypothetical protein Nham_2494 [Nitrobacter hamburgensis X14]